MRIYAEINDRGPVNRLRIVADRVQGLLSRTPLGRRIQAHQQTQSGLMFRRLRHGGSLRGVTWPWYAIQYRRITDGVIVPAEGGVPRLRAGRSARLKSGRFRKGAAQDIQTGRFSGGVRSTGREATVRGRLRPSGKRITSRSNLMRDRGQMASAAASVVRYSRGGNQMGLVTPVKYAPRQNRLRPFSFFTLEDARLYVRWGKTELLR